MSIDWSKIAREGHGSWIGWDNVPHPQAPDLTVKEFRVAVQLATAAKFGGHAIAQEATAFWKEYQPLREKGVSPDDFLHLLDQTAKVSFAYHGRPPTMPELRRFWDEKAGATKHPNEVYSYYQGLPDQHYPHVPAGEMVKALQKATPHARTHLGRNPLKNEAAYLHHSGASAEEYYKGLAAEVAEVSEKPLEPDAISKTQGGQDGAPDRRG